MPQTDSKAPRPADVLFSNLFGSRKASETFEKIADGLAACRTNAARLLSDARYLVEDDRLSSARFLLTTAKEEIAKCYILTDACRLDLEKHQSVLKRLCSAFYDHVYKHAYLEVVTFGDIRSIEHAKEIWDIEIVRWWPAPSPEDGEPDMPHDTYFDRELPLYTDFGDYDGCWLIPDDESQRVYFMEMFGDSPLSKAQQIVAAWDSADSLGLCTPRVLKILNENFKAHYFRDGKMEASIEKLYQKVATSVSEQTNVAADQFLESEFVQWPLYHFL